MFKMKKQTSKPTTSESTEWNSFGRGILLAVGHSTHFSLLLEDADEPAFPAPHRLKGFQLWLWFIYIYLYLFSKAVAPTSASIAVPCVPDLTCLAGLLDWCSLVLYLLKLKNSCSSVDCHGQQSLCSLCRMAGVTGIAAFPEFSCFFWGLWHKSRVIKSLSVRAVYTKISESSDLHLFHFGIHQLKILQKVFNVRFIPCI